MTVQSNQHKIKQQSFFIEKIFLSPFFPGLFILSAMILYFMICYIIRVRIGVFDVEEIGLTETLTYLFYGLGGGIVFMLYEDHIHTPRQKTYYYLCFLWFCALLREMGVQHWLTTHDTTAIKLRFFTNPDNPLHEKVITILLLLLVARVVIYLLYHYTKPVVSRFLKMHPVSWSIAFLGIWVCITQFADRLPAEYEIATGVELSEPVRFALKVLEEGGESLLPLLFAIAMLQFHFLFQRENASGEKQQNDPTNKKVE